MDYWLKLEASDITAISAVVIAFCSVLVTIWQAWSSNRHNVLSVKPHLYISGHFVKGEDIRFSIGNYGVGPAVIKDVLIIFADSKSRKVVSYIDYEVVFNELGIDLQNYSHKVRTFDMDTPIGSGQEISFIELLYTNEQHDLFVKMVDSLSSLKVQVTYNCIYQKKHVTFLNAVK